MMKINILAEKWQKSGIISNLWLETGKSLPWRNIAILAIPGSQ